MYNTSSFDIMKLPDMTMPRYNHVGLTVGDYLLVAGTTVD
jgi:hypothetical protein